MNWTQAVGAINVKRKLCEVLGFTDEIKNIEQDIDGVKKGTRETKIGKKRLLAKIKAIIDK